MEGSGLRFGPREDRGARYDVPVPAAATIDMAVPSQTQEPDEHVIWLDTTSRSAFMIVSPKYGGEISGWEHAWEALQLHLQGNRR